MIIGGYRKIGVLGGIGPEATCEFYDKFIKGLQRARLIESNRDFPQIIINSIPAPELIYDKVSEADLKPYIIGLKELDKYNMDFIVMVCNTIYLFYDILKKEIRTPILNLRSEVEKILIKKGIKSIFILGTPLTIKQGLYRFDKIKSFEPNDKEITQLSESISNFNRRIDVKTQIRNVRKLCRKYVYRVDSTILGCTELALMLNAETFPKINPSDILVEATITRLIQIKSRRCFEC